MEWEQNRSISGQDGDAAVCILFSHLLRDSEGMLWLLEGRIHVPEEQDEGKPSTCQLGTLKLVVVQLLSPVWLFVTPWIAARWASLSFTISWSLLKLMSVELVMPSNHLILCCPLLFLPSVFPSIRVFSSESALHIRWSKYWSFNFSISPSSEYSGLIFFRTDWFDLRSVQGALKSLPQYHILSVCKNDNQVFTDFTVYKTDSYIVTFSKWLWEFCSYPILF